MRSLTRRTLLASFALGVALYVTPGQARSAFHLALSKSDPMSDSTVASPKAIKLWFTEAPVLATSKVALHGADGKPVVLGKLTLDTVPKAPLTAPVPGTLAAGKYTVTWTTASSDGHAVSGTFAFTVKAAK